SRIRVVGEEIEAIERLRILIDPAARHVEAADCEAMIAEHLAEPGKEAPVLESLEAVHDHGKRLRPRRNVEIAADGKVLVAEDGELHDLKVVSGQWSGNGDQQLVVSGHQRSHAGPRLSDHWPLTTGHSSSHIESKQNYVPVLHHVVFSFAA